MFYGGLSSFVVCLAISIILFRKNHVAELVRDIMAMRRKSVILEVQEEIGFRHELVTDVLVAEEVCVEQFFEVVEDVIVTHTNQRM